MTMVQQAVFLVGGRGTRLGHLAKETPKPLMEIEPDRRFLDYILENTARQGFTEILLLAGHLGEQVEARYNGMRVRGANVSVIREHAPQGTGGALRLAADRLDSVFLLANGDSYFDINIRALAAGLPTKAAARLALREVPDPGRYGSVVLENETVVRFLEKDPHMAGPALINGGIYVLRREFAESVTGPCSIESDIFPELAATGRLEGKAFDGYFLDIGLPETLSQAKLELPLQRERQCVFLDRDGVLNADSGYTHQPEDLVWIAGAREAVRYLNDRGCLVIVITNQAGIAKGYYTEEDMHRFHHAMTIGLAAEGAHIDDWYHCPYHGAGIVAPFAVADHPDRKPNPGMILKALADWPVQRQGSFVVGDRESDLEAARREGLQGHLFDGGNLLEFLKSLTNR